ncbi:MAG: glycosyltransferase family 1 protein [Burkholderiales bacterium]|nr:glycosyltransferase family 1 protein [Burkholderiales bacterium]MDE1926507.1 glycosyltransferase family 1 protein [Burkholderiales bacterium]MDE2158483.1 glycosyltransferase family 1 protein [Burkholderiales bacterium]MDE2502638.1 glycosyltransferase family 1 protein [Burkholderiales bacterium]
MPLSAKESFVIDLYLPPRRSLRIATVTETYPPEINGVAATAARVVEGLRERGHELQLIRPRQAGGEAASSSGPYSEVLMRGLPIPRYPQLKMGLPSKRALVQLWTAQRPDVVHIVTEGPLGWSALQAAAHLRLPVVSDFRTNFHAYSRHYGVAWLRKPIMGYLRKFHNRTACTMVPTEALRDELADAGFKRLRVVARGVDTRLFDPARRSEALRASWGAKPGTLVALCVGRLAPEKNLGTVIAAAEAMRSLNPDLKLVLVGDGPEQPALMQRFPAAVFAGVRRGTDLAAHYASADAFLFASVTETFGNVVPEAMASGLAVVAYDYAAAGQLIRSGDNGLLVPVDDADDFCRTAQRLAGDPVFVRGLGERARAKAAGMDWSQIVQQVETEYLDAMTPSAAATRPDWRPALPVA